MQNVVAEGPAISYIFADSITCPAIAAVIYAKSRCVINGTISCAIQVGRVALSERKVIATGVEVGIPTC